MTELQPHRDFECLARSLQSRDPTSHPPFQRYTPSTMNIPDFVIAQWKSSTLFECVIDPVAR